MEEEGSFMFINLCPVSSPRSLGWLVAITVSRHLTSRPSSGLFPAALTQQIDQFMITVTLRINSHCQSGKRNYEINKIYS